ncbi:MAG TPA: hypothetical protein VMZ52_12625 [Bryobacteraceae bacterium]|nr:hypothetical protein [Bryobacteraceae bacterium]
MRRRAFLAAPLLVWPGLAGPADDVLQRVGKLASALSGGDPAAFLAQIHQSSPDFSSLRSNVYALLAQAEVSSSVEPAGSEGEAEKFDWSMELRGREIGALLERRRQTVTIKFAKGKILSLGPVSFFAPPKVTTP